MNILSHDIQNDIVNEIKRIRICAKEVKNWGKKRNDITFCEIKYADNPKYSVAEVIQIRRILIINQGKRVMGICEK